eukprot:TRINITY_DN2857_c0_g2_i1.p1 TRINITY_DN2857_c0_g2~~TRINITY_DN2857_c0_g2_i1.p1  ORF type:complete len:341 (-),score=32.33 TRINITY_DN2857_c0_g2_i1:2623-3645(-)
MQSLHPQEIYQREAVQRARLEMWLRQSNHFQNGDVYDQFQCMSPLSCRAHHNTSQTGMDALTLKKIICKRKNRTATFDTTSEEVDPVVDRYPAVHKDILNVKRRKRVQQTNLSHQIFPDECIQTQTKIPKENITIAQETTTHQTAVQQPHPQIHGKQPEKRQQQLSNTNKKHDESFKLLSLYLSRGAIVCPGSHEFSLFPTYSSGNSSESSLCTEDSGNVSTTWEGYLVDRKGVEIMAVSTNDVQEDVSQHLQQVMVMLGYAKRHLLWKACIENFVQVHPKGRKEGILQMARMNFMGLVEGRGREYDFAITFDQPKLVVKVVLIKKGFIDLLKKQKEILM